MQGYIIPGIIIVMVALLVYTYNNLVSMRNVVDGTWANIDALLQKRFDLVPNLVATVKGYLQHEREVLENVTRARTAWQNSSSVNDSANADQMITGALKTLFAVSENYPELKANQNFLMLQEELTGLESKIAYARQRYNRTVVIYNTAIQRFPNSLLASPLNFLPKEFFSVESEQVRKPPQIEF
ncbi:MAG TPA: LemA family protein [Firmicutes bacterium]|nr:LemA family protein [Bacillota bacterium]